MQCDRAGQVHAYHDGELDAAAAAAVEAHAADCPPCAALLADLRGLSRMFAAAPFRAMPDRAAARFHGAWHAAARDHDLRRTARWLTAVAAALLLGALLRWPAAAPPARPVARTDAGGGDLSALIPPAAPAGRETHGDADAELVQFAQWMAIEPSYGEGRP